MNFFDDVATDINNVQKEFLGPNYDYYNKIANPSELGMSSNGDMGSLAKDVAGIIDYVEVLVSGSGPANKPGKPLGDKFILPTAGQCKDYKSNKVVTRSMYINNVPTKSIPIISNLSGMDFPDFRGIVPGVMEDMYSINPLKMFSAFMEGSEPICAEVNLNTRDSNDNTSTKAAFIPISELQSLEYDGKIPQGTVTDEMKSALNKEGFTNLYHSNYNNTTSYHFLNYKNIYLTSLSLLLLFISIKFMQK